jgi:hypothetical protein
VIKRWKRPEVLIRGGQTATLRFDVYHDYNDHEIKRTLFAETEAPDDDAMIWDSDTVGNWDANLWAGDSESTEVLVKLNALGRSRAVRFKITGPTSTSVRWQLDAITLKYIPLRVRN